jgi:hypothetical protein
MLANPGTDTRVKLYVDNVYVDNTRARVEIGDNAVFTDCTRKDPQIPSVWSDGSITAQVNLGSFKEGETAYVYVVDKDGNASQGYPVTIGEEKTNLSMSMQATGKYGVNIPQGENFEFKITINNHTSQTYSCQLVVDAYRQEELYKTGLCDTPTGIDIPAESTLELNKFNYITKDTAPGPYTVRAYLLDGNSEVASAELKGTVEPALGRRRQMKERATK